MNKKCNKMVKGGWKGFSGNKAGREKGEGEGEGEGEKRERERMHRKSNDVKKKIRANKSCK